MREMGYPLHSGNPNKLWFRGANKMSAERIRSLVEEWLKSGDNCVPGELKNLLQHRVNPQQLKVLNRRIVERYKDGSLSLHFHILERIPQTGRQLWVVEGNSDITEYCAIAQFCVADNHVKERGRSMNPIHPGVVGNSSSQCRRPVLIDIMESVQGLQRLVPTVVRLETLNECSGFFGKPVKPLSSDVSGECGRTASD